MNLPPAGRGAYLEFMASSTALPRRCLKGTRARRQWSATISRTCAALSWVAETWIFQPWSGVCGSSGWYMSQTRAARCRQPSGSGANRDGTRCSSAAARAGVSKNTGSTRV
ncbi:hypothetical protein SMD44_08266 [Streptomyces alboflavus]|uniref:Uncharacterized protein n=1 Tax=Streptomyces alboflavus TaxID=67267 RepID=A0A1Z1WQV6_9ACTN|nr:hypothetical protein SMD44_08266 [Streptomyces alboflavus]